MVLYARKYLDIAQTALYLVSKNNKYPFMCSGGTITKKAFYSAMKPLGILWLATLTVNSNHGFYYSDTHIKLPSENEEHDNNVHLQGTISLMWIDSFPRNVM